MWRGRVVSRALSMVPCVICARMVASMRGVVRRIKRGWRVGFGVSLGLGDGSVEESDDRLDEWRVRR